jgi:hypothetical protein
LEEDVVDGPANEGSKIEEFAIDAMKRSLEKVSLTGVFRVEKIKQLIMKIS